MKEKFVFDKAKTAAKGTILLIHGTAAQNIDGQIADERLRKMLKEKDPSHYIINPTYKDLAKFLNERGWNTVRYTRLGVYQDQIVADEYKKTDLKNIMDQLKSIWSDLPKDKPRIAFAWSGGSVHVSQLPLSEASAVIILGGISTKRTDVYRAQAKSDEEKIKLDKELAELLAKHDDPKKREELAGPNYPYARFFDENDLNENWTYYKGFPKLPLLILQGDSDAEVNVSQSKVWREKLPTNNITVKIKPNGNHAWGTNGNQPDMADLAKTMDEWLTTTVLAIHHF